MSWHGETNGNGFALKYQSTTVYTPGYGKKTYKDTVHPTILIIADALWIITTIGIASVIFFIPAYWTGSPMTQVITAFTWIVGAVSIGMVLYAAISCLFFPKEEAQWHGAEHMIIKLLESNENLTLGNIKAKHPFSWCCGTVMYPPLFAAFATVAQFGTLTTIYDYNEASWLLNLYFKVASCLPLAALILFAVLEYTKTTAYPSEEKLEVALEAGKAAKKAVSQK